MHLLLICLTAIPSDHGETTIPRGGHLEEGARLLAEYRAYEAVDALQHARDHEGPYPYVDHVRLYELLGIAYAYVDQPKRARAAFEQLLLLQPDRMLSYTLSPKVTFLFEEVRNAARLRPVPTVDISWPRGLRPDQPLTIDIEAVSDPGHFLHRARLYARRQGDPEWRTYDVVLPHVLEYVQVKLAPVAPDASRDETLQLYLIAHDRHDNEVLIWGTPEQPREILMKFQPTEPLYKKWWLWAVLGGVTVAASITTAVLVTGNNTPETLPIRFDTTTVP